MIQFSDQSTMILDAQSRLPLTVRTCPVCLGLGYRMAVVFIRYYGARFRHDTRVTCTQCGGVGTVLDQRVRRQRKAG